METIISAAIGIIALVVALFGVYYAKEQVRLAKNTKSQTENLLTEIKKKVDEIKRIAEKTEDNLNNQINTLLKNFDPNVQAQNKMMEQFGPALMQQLFSSPEMQKKMNDEIIKSFGDQG